MPSFNGSDIERMDRTDSAKVPGRRVSECVDSSAVAGAKRPEWRENGARGMRLISSRRERANESAGGGRETLSPHSNRGDEAVCCAREREFTAEVPLTD